MRDLGRGDEALTRYQASLTIRERLAASEPDRADYQRDLSISHERMASVAIEPADALQWEQRGIDIHRRLLSREPDRADLAQELAVKLVNRAGRSEVPADLLGEAVLLLESLAAADQLDEAGQQALNRTRSMGQP